MSSTNCLQAMSVSAGGSASSGVTWPPRPSRGISKRWSPTWNTPSCVHRTNPDGRPGSAQSTILGWVTAAGVVGFVGNELAAQYRIRIGRRIGSAALVADGLHARTDGLTSLAVVLSAIATFAGLARADGGGGL